MSVTVESLVNQVSDVYSLPTIFIQLEEAINDPFCNLDEIAKILSDDAGISARLLRLANSAMYAFPSKVETITRAITIIGTKQLHDLVLATCVITLFKNIPKEIVDMDAFWRHSIATGICARVIATYQRTANIERFYLMGLLHDLGRLVMYIQIPKVVGQQILFCKKNKLLLHKLEKQHLEFDHAEVGQQLLQAWRLPDSICKTVGYHHKPMRSLEFKNEAAVIHVADSIAHSLSLGTSGEIFVPPIDDRAWQLLNLKSSQIPAIVAHMEKQYDDVVDIFLS